MLPDDDYDDDEDFEDEDDGDDLDEDDADLDENQHFMEQNMPLVSNAPKYLGEQMPEEPVKFVATNEGISVVDGGKTYNIKKGAPNYEVLMAALEAKNWLKARASLETKGSLAQWASGRFTFNAAGGLLFDGQPVEHNFGRRVMEMATNNQSPMPLFRFYERLQRNPSFRSVQQLFTFLDRLHIPITPDGCFLAYKGVTYDFTDVHSQTCGDKNCGHQTYDNRPGNVHEMPRNRISDDPDIGCHTGFHVGSVDYARGFGARVVVCKIDPEHVVCVPKDCSYGKVRVCKYAVVGHLGEPLPSEVMEEPVEVPAMVQEKLPDLPTFEDLMEMPVDHLRYMAVNELGMVGAGHIQGGKAVLVTKMMEVIGGQGKPQH